MENQKDRYNIADILERLSCIPMDDEIRNEIVSSLSIYMRLSVRHNYHEITRYIIDHYSSENESETVYVILDNIDRILDYIKESWECKNNNLMAPRDCIILDHEGKCELLIESQVMRMPCWEWKKLYRFVMKLKDHIFLEFVRLSEIRKENARIDEELQELEKTGESIKVMASDLRTSVDKATKDTKNIYLQMVSILGIFTAIVISVFGGLSAISGILDGLSMVTLEDKKNVLFSVALIISFVIDIVFMLVILIGNMWSDYKPKIWISILVLAINICCFAAVLYSMGIIGNDSGMVT